MRLVLLGDPVVHSRSPSMHEAALRAAGLTGSYVARRVDTDGMRLAAEEMREGSLDGANITMPHKRLARMLADEVEGEAARAGSVNTWQRDGGRLVGHSTDISGLRRLWSQLDLSGESVLVLGSGGAAAAAVVALGGLDIRVAARNPARAGALLTEVGVAGQVAEWGAPAEGSVVVNATPLGMRGERLPGGTMTEAAGLVDMAYGPTVTPAVQEAADMGVPFADGIDVLVAQAEDSFYAWTGLHPAPGVMESAARKTSRGPGAGPNHS